MKRDSTVLLNGVTLGAGVDGHYHQREQSILFIPRHLEARYVGCSVWLRGGQYQHNAKSRFLRRRASAKRRWLSVIRTGTMQRIPRDESKLS